MNKSTLYYTDNEISQFKQEYKDEKKMLKLQEQRGFAELLDDYDDNKQDGDEGGEEDSSPSTTTSCQDAKTNDDIETHHAKEEEASCDNKDNTDDMDDMYKAQHQNLVSVLNLIFAFKRQEDIIERLEQDNARMIQWWWRRERSRRLAAIKQEEEDKVTTKSRKGRLTGTPKQEYQTKKWEVNNICCTDEDTTVTDTASFITARCTIDEYDYDDEDSECIDRINNDMDIQYRLQWRRVGDVVKLLHHFKTKV